MARDWSLGGFRVSGFEGEAALGAALDCTLSIPFQGFEVSFDATAKVVRRGPGDGELACQFTDLSERATSLLSHFVDEIVRGYMTPVEDTIQRIDVPVTPVSINPDAHPEAAKPPLRRLRAKSLFMGAFYGVAGLALFAYIALVVYGNFFRLEVDTGVVSAPIEPVLAATDGRIARLHAAAGVLVEAGAPLVTLEDPRLEEKIAFAEIGVQRARTALAGLEDAVGLERGKLADYRTFAVEELDKAKSQAAALEQRLGAARAQVGRLDKLVGQGWASKVRYDEAAAELARLDGEYQAAKISIRQGQTVLGLVESGRYFNGDRFEGQLAELEAKVEQARREVELTLREREALQQHRDRLVLFAPARGRLVRIMKSAGVAARRGEAVALFERDEDRVIEVFLTQDELLEVGLGDEARVYFPSLGTRARAVVSSVDRTSGYIDEVESRYDWRGPRDRSAKVTLTFSRLPAAEVRERFAAGLPVIATFGRSSVRDWVARLTGGRAYAAQRGGE